MGVAPARSRSARGAIVVAPRMSAYSEASKAVYRVFDDTTPLVEGLSIDEAFLDVRGLRRLSGSPTRDRRRGCGARCASGSGCRSRSGSRGRSSWPRSRAAWPSPTGCCVVPPDRELAFLHPLPVERLWGVGPRDGETAPRRRDHDRRPGRRASARTRSSRCSAARPGRHLHALAHNRDPRPVQAAAAPALDRSAAGARPVADIARRGRRRRSSALVDRVTRRMRAADRVGRTVVLRLRFDDFSRATRSHTLPYATANTRTILVAARGCSRSRCR